MSAYDYCFKVLVLGESNAGKTSICTRISGTSPNIDVTPTIGVEFYSYSFVSSEGPSIKCQVWDLAGAQLYRSIVKDYYKEVAAAIIVFDVSSRLSFSQVAHWHSELQEAELSDPLGILLIGNKTDKRRLITRGEGEELARSLSVRYAETSALKGDPRKCISEFLESLLKLEHMPKHKGIKRFPTRDPYASLDARALLPSKARFVRQRCRCLCCCL